ncbi:MerR family transcriptional regulator [Paenibacillus sp. PK4536]|uniref:Putative HTH-type transcriptional regulator n=1 Tax=Paenibacillus nuruki TaxID=1886670 RepID=A0A1E3L0D7_9BACL|nr:MULTISPECIES: MerR family transcriptional regulator [Paenibacillus]ODP27186.1 putative HTH-type transcriptional regulator [Paenibacillus nuruki]TKJ92871.1 MerR family transcriptional regulator [Paenibacillus sp. CFBP13512]WIM38363.1 MerR family transcriptional regulator [Paenibacillus sp. PK4536]CAJ1314956.1 MerR family transcriptional regulator [Paenibacillus nuruki]
MSTDLEQKNQLSIGEVAERSGLSVHSLRFYEREGLLLSTRIARDEGGRRRYSEVDVEWLYICTRLRASGMPIAQIRRFAELVRMGPGNEHERLDILKEHQQRVVSQMEHLNDCLEVITLKTNVYEKHLNRNEPEQTWENQHLTASEASTDHPHSKSSHTQINICDK